MPEIRMFTPQGSKRSYPTLVLNPGDRYEFSLGLGKCQMVLDHIDEIRAFVESDGREPQGPGGQGRDGGSDVPF